MTKGSVILHAIKTQHFTCFLDLELNYTAHCKDIATELLKNESAIKYASLNGSLVQIRVGGISGDHLFQPHTPEKSQILPQNRLFLKVESCSYWFYCVIGYGIYRNISWMERRGTTGRSPWGYVQESRNSH